jgi:hypothetical protein
MTPSDGSTVDPSPGLELAQPTFGFLGLLISLVFMAVPIVILGYALWLLTRLTKAVERIEERLHGQASPGTGQNPG